MILSFTFLKLKKMLILNRSRFGKLCLVLAAVTSVLLLFLNSSLSDVQNQISFKQSAIRNFITNEQTKDIKKIHRTVRETHNSLSYTIREIGIDKLNNESISIQISNELENQRQMRDILENIVGISYLQMFDSTVQPFTLGFIARLTDSQLIDSLNKFEEESILRMEQLNASLDKLDKAESNRMQLQYFFILLNLILILVGNYLIFDSTDLKNVSN